MATQKCDTQKYDIAISVNAAAKKYGVPQRTLANWAKRSRIRVLAYPEKPGQKMLVDETSVVTAIQHRRRYLPRNPPGLLEPTPPFKYCPYCGRPFHDGDHTEPLSPKT